MNKLSAVLLAAILVIPATPAYALRGQEAAQAASAAEIRAGLEEVAYEGDDWGALVEVIREREKTHAVASLAAYETLPDRVVLPVRFWFSKIQDSPVLFIANHWSNSEGRFQFRLSFSDQPFDPDVPVDPKAQDSRKPLVHAKLDVMPWKPPSGSLGGLQVFLQREDVTGGAAGQGKGIRGRTLTGIPGQSYDAIVFDQFHLQGLLSERLSDLNQQGPFTWADVATGPGVAPREGARKFSNLQPLLVDAVSWKPEQYDPTTLQALAQRAREVGVDDMFSSDVPIHIADALTVDLKSLAAPGFPLRAITMINALAYNQNPLGIVVNLFNQLEPSGLLLTNLYLPMRRGVKDKSGTIIREEDYPEGDRLAKFYGRLESHLKALRVNADFRILDFSKMRPGERNSQGEEGPFKEHAVGILLRKREGQQLKLLRDPSRLEEVTIVNSAVRPVTYWVADYGEDPSQVIGVQAGGLEEVQVKTVEELRGMGDADAAELAGQLEAVGKAGVALLPKNVVDGQRIRQGAYQVKVYAHERVRAQTVMLLPDLWSWDGRMNELHPDPARAKKQLQAAAGEATDDQTVVIGLDVRKRTDALDLADVKAVKILFDPATMNQLDRNRRQISAFLSRPNALANVILDLTSGTVRTVTIGDTEYYALDIAA